MYVKRLCPFLSSGSLLLFNEWYIPEEDLEGSLGQGDEAQRVREHLLLSHLVSVGLVHFASLGFIGVTLNHFLPSEAPTSLRKVISTAVHYVGEEPRHIWIVWHSFISLHLMHLSFIVTHLHVHHHHSMLIQYGPVSSPTHVAQLAMLVV